MSEKSIKNIIKSDSNFALTFNYHHLLSDMNFNEQFNKKNGIYIPRKLVNLHISYTLVLKLRNLNTDFTLLIDYLQSVS